MYFYYHANQTRKIVKGACFAPLFVKEGQEPRNPTGRDFNTSFMRLLLPSSIDLLRRMAATIQTGTWRRSMLMLALGLHGVGGLNPKDGNILAKRKLEAAAKHDTSHASSDDG